MKTNNCQWIWYDSSIEKKLMGWFHEFLTAPKSRFQTSNWQNKKMYCARDYFSLKPKISKLSLDMFYVLLNSRKQPSKNWWLHIKNRDWLLFPANRMSAELVFPFYVQFHIWSKMPACIKGMNMCSAGRWMLCFSVHQQGHILAKGNSKCVTAPPTEAIRNDWKGYNYPCNELYNWINELYNYPL